MTVQICSENHTIEACWCNRAIDSSVETLTESAVVSLPLLAFCPRSADVDTSPCRRCGYTHKELN
jgi:hypothetical protein